MYVNVSAVGAIAYVAEKPPPVEVNVAAVQATVYVVGLLLPVSLDVPAVFATACVVDKPFIGYPSAGTLDISPTKILPNATHIVTFIGAGTEWLTYAPTFSPDGLGVATVGDVTVVNDTVAKQSVIYGDAVGVVTWTDGTTGSTRNQRVTEYLPSMVFKDRKKFDDITVPIHGVPRH